MNTKSKALLFGLNYNHIPEARLNGCINDVNLLGNFLTAKLNIPCTIYTDDNNLQDTSAVGITSRLGELALQTWKDKLDFVWIHFSGHGTYARDVNQDELDGKDECIVPSNFNRAGVVSDDVINRILSQCNPKTKVVLVFDCCHSGTICDLKFSWDVNTRKPQLENARTAYMGKLISISGCLDSQVSMDAYDILGDKKYGGALTCCLYKLLSSGNTLYTKDALLFVKELRRLLKVNGFVQVPVISSSYDIVRDPILIPM